MVEEIYRDLKEQFKLDLGEEELTGVNDSRFIYRDFLAGISYKTLRPKPSSDVYVACFCEKDDLLSQWRGYGHMGSGYAIGFDTKQIIHPDYSFKLRKVIYSVEEQQQMLREVLEAVIASFKKVTDGMNFDIAEPHIEAHNLIFEEEVVKYSAFFKHPAFWEEQEWRLIYFPPENAQSSQIKFRGGNLGIIPYAEISIPDGANDSQAKILPITSVRMGPTAQPVLAQKALEMLASSNYPYLEIF